MILKLFVTLLILCFSSVSHGQNGLDSEYVINYSQLLMNDLKSSGLTDYDGISKNPTSFDATSPLPLLDPFGKKNPFMPYRLIEKLDLDQ